MPLKTLGTSLTKHERAVCTYSSLSSIGSHLNLILMRKDLVENFEVGKPSAGVKIHLPELRLYTFRMQVGWKLCRVLSSFFQTGTLVWCLRHTSKL